MKYQIISPDGFSINREGGFKTKKAALTYFEQWKEGFIRQGYYSSPQHGRIAPVDLMEYCQFNF